MTREWETNKTGPVPGLDRYDVGSGSTRYCPSLPGTRQGPEEPDSAEVNNFPTCHGQQHT